MFVTVDGAKSWDALTKITVGAGGFRHNQLVYFLDTQTGWAGCVEALQGTRDGGQTWERESLPPVLPGPLYLTHDGTVLTVTGPTETVVLRYQGR